MTRQQSFAARERRSPRLRVVATPARTAVLVVAGMLLAALLAAPALLETAQRQPYGPARTVLVETAESLAAISGAAHLDVPWRLLDAAVHGTDGTPTTSLPLTAPPPAEVPTPVGPDPTTSPPAPDEVTTPSPTRDEVTTSPVPDPPAEDPPSPTGRVPTAEDPLRVWIAGDSMWERPGPKLVSGLEATGVVDVVGLEFRYSTGLTRPDFFDWPAHASAQLAALEPEVVLFLVGPNDSQPLVQEAGVAHSPRTAGFDAAYTARVRAMMEVLAGGADEVLWIGLPIMRDADFDQRMRDLDLAYAAAADGVLGVDHVPTRDVFADAEGRYVDYLPGPDGALRSMRNRDGIHLSDAGAERLARLLVDLLDGRHRLNE